MASLDPLDFEVSYFYFKFILYLFSVYIVLQIDHTAPLAVRCPNIPVSICSDDEWRKAIYIRNELLCPTRHYLKVPREINNQRHLQTHESTLSELLKSVKWQELGDLSVAEMEYYYASLQLLAALSTSRNVWSEKSSSD